MPFGEVVHVQSGYSLPEGQKKIYIYSVHPCLCFKGKLAGSSFCIILSN